MNSFAAGEGVGLRNPGERGQLERGRERVHAAHGKSEMAVGGRVDPVRNRAEPGRDVSRAARRAGSMAVQEAAKGLELHVEAGREKVHFDAPSASAILAASDDRGEYPEGEERGAVVIDDRRPHRNRRTARVAGRGREAGQGLDEQVLSRPFTVGPVAAVPGGRSVDDPGVEAPAVLVSESELLHAPGPEVLHHHVRRLNEAPRDLLPVLRLEVEGEASLVPSDGEVIDALTVDEEVSHRPVALERPPGRLHADHVRPEIGEVLRGRRPHQHVVEARDPKALQQVHGAARNLSRGPDGAWGPFANGTGSGGRTSSRRCPGARAGAPGLPRKAGAAGRTDYIAALASSRRTSRRASAPRFLANSSCRCAVFATNGAVSTSLTSMPASITWRMNRSLACRS